MGWWREGTSLQWYIIMAIPIQYEIMEHHRTAPIMSLGSIITGIESRTFASNW